jgi:hypothetical protein
VVLDHPQLTATQLPNSATNYKLQLASHSDSSTRIGEVRIDSGQARVRLAKLKADMTIAVATRNQGEAQLVADAHGTYNARPMTMRFSRRRYWRWRMPPARGRSTFASRMAQHR